MASMDNANGAQRNIADKGFYKLSKQGTKIEFQITFSLRCFNMYKLSVNDISISLILYHIKDEKIKKDGYQTTIIITKHIGNG